MALVEFNWKPTNRQLRQFGLICVVALPLIGWLWGATGQWLAGLAGGGLLAALVALLYPPAMRPIFVGLMLCTTPIGIVAGELAMLAIYFTVFLPIGLCFRVMGRDRLQLKLDKAAKTYWQAKAQPKSAASYYRQS